MTVNLTTLLCLTAPTALMLLGRLVRMHHQRPKSFTIIVTNTNHKNTSSLSPFFHGCGRIGAERTHQLYDDTQQRYALEEVRKATRTDDVTNLHLTDGTI